MVGVAGKYKGCNCCRIRRVKCDGGRPSCKKCLNTKRECSYERPATFIVATVDQEGRCSSHPHRSQLVSKKKQAAIPPPPPLPPPPPSETSPPPLSVTSSSSPSVTRRTVSWADSSPQSDISHQYHLQFFMLHEQCLAEERLYGIENPIGDSFGTAFIIERIPELAFHSPSFDCSLLALSLLSISNKTPDPRLMEARKQMSSETLVKLRVALRDTHGAKTIGSMAARMCLFLFDSGNSGSLSTNWKSLVEETASSLKEMGPFSFKKFPEQHLFSCLFRKTILWQALGSCHTTFLSLFEWTTVPWEEVSKNPMDILADNMIQLPMLFERGRSLQSTTPSLGRRLKILDYLQNCFRIDTMFQTWYEDTRNKSESFLHWTLEPNPTADPVFPSKFAFSNFQTALLHLDFWASLTLFYTLIYDTHALLSEPYLSNTSGMAYARPSNHQPLHPKYLPAGISVLAGNICQSLDYCLGNEKDGLAPVALLAPIGCAQEWFCKRFNGSKEDTWCRDLMKKLTDTGFPLVEELSRVRWEL